MEMIAEVLSSGDSGQRRTVQPGLETLSAGGVQSCCGSRVDSAVNTDPDWEEQIRTMLESGGKLSEEFNTMKLKQQQDELDFSKTRGDLQKKRDQAVKQHQALLEKLESVRVKLQLNNSKATRKSFLSKIQEVTSEKNLAQEERDRLCEQLSEVDLRLSSLRQEQEAERTRWEQDLTELRSQTERAQKQARDAQSKATKDQRETLEKQRHQADEMVTAWNNQVGVYLSGMRAEFPHRYRQEKSQWDRRLMSVKKNQTEFHAKINLLFQALDRPDPDPDLDLDLSLPALPQVPMAELYFHRIVQTTPCPPAPPPALVPPIVNPRGPALFPLRHAHFPLKYPPLPRQHFPPPHASGAAPSPMVPPTHPQTPPPQALTPPPPPTASNPDKTCSSAPPPGVVGKLDKVLERLGAQFPRCSRAQLTWLLQQVKSDRGTLAGLSMDHVVEQIRLRLETSSSYPRAAIHAQTAPPLAPPSASAPPSAPVPRKPCLVCQKPVDSGSKFELSCSHTVHTDCIQVWLQSSKSHSCPFCPSK